MKLNLSTNTVEIFGAETPARTFDVNVSQLAFDIITTKNYSDLVTAVMREVACNAYDAHVMVGKRKKPFDFFLPTQDRPEFVVRDYGPGLSDENLYRLYCTLFASSKSDSNKQIGGFGIGSKAPFAYTDGFTVISRQNGEKRTYSLFRNEERIPSIVRLNTEPTEEEDGLEVRVPVAAKHIFEFENKARDVLEFFDPMPNMNRSHFMPRKQEYLAEGKNWKMRKQGYGVRVIQGLVAYKVGGMSGVPMNAEQATVLGMALDVFLPIGHLAVASSRESLTTEKETIDRLLKVATGIHADMVEQARVKTDSFKTGWELAQYLWELDTSNNAVMADMMRKSLRPEDKRISLVELKRPDFPLISVIKLSYTYGSFNAFKIFSPYEAMMNLHERINVLNGKSAITFNKNNDFVIADMPSKVDYTVRRVLRASGMTKGGDVIVVRPHRNFADEKEFDKQAFMDQAAAFITAIGEPPTTLLSDLKAKLPVYVPQARESEPARRCVILKQQRCTLWQDLWERTTDELPKDGVNIYVLSERGRVDGRGDQHGRNWQASALQLLEHEAFGGGAELYSFTPKSGPPKRSKARWVEFSVFMQEKADAYFAHQAATFEPTDLPAWFVSGVLTLGDVTPSSLKRLSPDSLFVQVREMIYRDKYLPNKTNEAESLQQALDQLRIQYDKSGIEGAINRHHKVLSAIRAAYREAYPRLRDIGNISHQMEPFIVEYIQAMDKELVAKRVRAAANDSALSEAARRAVARHQFKVVSIGPVTVEIPQSAAELAA